MNANVNMIILETRGLSRFFGGLRAVDDVDLKVKDGEFHSIIGPNGAGKTTLLNLLSGTLKPTNGSVYFRGADITHLPPHKRAPMGIGRSYQITNIFPTLTVLENIRLAAQSLGKDNFRILTDHNYFQKYFDIANEAAVQAGLSDKTAIVAAALPHGDKRRLEVAMLLAQDPDVLLLDEPTAGLAAEQVPEFMDMVQKVKTDTGKTIVLVEHNMGVVMRLSDRITVMHQGMLLAEGTAAEIAANETVQTAYLGNLYGDLNEMTGEG